MPYLPEQLQKRLRLSIVLPEVVAVILGVSAIALSHQHLELWLVGVMLIVLHTLLFYRLGKVSERIRTEGSPAFLRGFKRGLTGHPE